MEDIEEALIKAIEMLSHGGGAPDSIWHPEFGWVLINGEPTETTKAFLEYIGK